MTPLHSPLVAFAAGLTIMLAMAHAQPIKTTLEVRDGQQTLLRAGKPYYIQGVGGNGDRKLLAELGGNSVRTWGDDGGTQDMLDQSQKLGLSVAMGLRLTPERHGMDYNNPGRVSQQRDAALATVRKFKDHPAILMWGVGNEVEGYEKGDNPRIYQAINEIAREAKKIDPNHPTMIVIAEIGGERIRMINENCPDVDIVGLNSYGGAASVAKRYAENGGKKPIALTEFGPRGTWEVAKAFGVALEPTSTQKAEQYREAYQNFSTGPGKQNVLGSYAFLWGDKQEVTPTWFGMLLENGNRVGAADVIGEMWSGKAPRNRVPTIQPIKLEGSAEVTAGAKVKASVDAKDPEGKPLKYQWALQKEVTNYSTGGDKEDAHPVITTGLDADAKGNVTITLPADAKGVYRLYVYVFDTAGGAATHNVPIKVK